MKGWLLYPTRQAHLPATAYEIHRFIEEARQQNIDLQVIAPDQVQLIVPPGDRKSVLVGGEPQALPDFVLPYAGAHLPDFARAILRQMAARGVLVLNAANPTADKLATQQRLAAHGLPVARTLLVKFPVEPRLVERTLGFPVVVKPLAVDSRLGVMLAGQAADFADLMQLIGSLKPEADIILQEFIQTSWGRDLRVLVAGGRVVAAVERGAIASPTRTKITRHDTGTAYPVTPAVELLALTAARLLNLDVAAVDLLFDIDRLRIGDVTPAPDFGGLESAHPGLSVPEAVFRYIWLRLGAFDRLPVFAAPTDEPIATDELPESSMD